MLKLMLTDGKSQFTAVFDPIVDHKDVQAIRISKKPVSTAFSIIKKRWDLDTGVYPMQQALLGL